MRKIERRLWRERTTRMDEVFVTLRSNPPATATALAAETGFDVQDVEGLLEDLLIDAVVSKAGEFYWPCYDDLNLH